MSKTFDSGEFSAEMERRVSGIWGAGDDPSVRPHMTIKAEAAAGASAKGQPSAISDSHLVIRSRSVRDTQHKTAARTLGARESATSPLVDYELLEVLGQGGMGVVYAARQASIDRTVALKMLKSDVAGNREQRQKFLAEAAVTGELDHPNIVPIYDLGSNEEGALFYSMKRVHGTPWVTVIGKMSLAENIETLMKVADAVGFAHSRGVIHRDLKPENVMLGDFGEVLLMDWGLAQSSAYTRKAGPITQTSMGGTPAYMAPEMATGPIERIGPASDIYLLGAILYEIITGKPPHTGRTVMSCLFAAAKNEIQPTARSGELLDIAFKAMSTAPEDRYGSVREFQAAVREYQSHSESVVLSVRAGQELAEAEKSGDYQAFARAMFGFQEAAALWSGNAKARSGLAAATLAYAASALAKGDYDLAASLLDAGNPAHHDLLARIKAAESERDARQRRLKALKRATVAGVALFLVVVSGASFWIWIERNSALLAQAEAVKQGRIALGARDRAKEQEAEAKRQATIAVAARNNAQQQEAEAKKQEAEAKKQSELADQAREREEYEAYVARIGLAAAKIDENSFDHALEILDECRPDLRHWEWGRLLHLCRQNRTFAAEAPVNSIAFDPDGKRFVSGSWDGAARIWDVAQGSVLVDIPYGGLYVHAVAFSPDGQYVATGGNDKNGYVKLWRADSGELVRTFEGHTDSVLSVTFSRDGGRLLTSSYDKTARLWDVATGRQLRAFQGHNWWVWCAVFSPDETRIVTTSQDGTAIVWPLDRDAPVALPVFNGHEGPVYSAAFSPDGRRVATGGYDKRVLVWDPDQVRAYDLQKLVAGDRPEPPAYQALEDHTAAVRSVRFSADGSMLLSGGQDNSVKLWSTDTGKLLKTLRGHAGWVYSCAFSPDGQWVLSGASDQQAKLWSIAAYEEVRVLRGRLFQGHTDAVLAAAFSPDGRQVVTASRDHTARTWDVSTGETIHTFEEGHEFLASAAVFFPNSKQLLTSAVDNTVRIWDVATGAQRQILEHTGRSAAAALSHDGRWILTGSDDKSARLWDAATGQLLRTLTGHSSEVTAVAFSPDDQLFYTGDTAGHGWLWEAATGAELHLLEGHSRKVVQAGFLPIGGRLLTASADNTVAQWDIQTGRELPELILRHPEGVVALAISNDGGLALTSCHDGKVRLWDVEHARLAGLINDPSSLVNAVAISADGGRALTASTAERTVRLWDLATGQEIQGRAGGAFVDLAAQGGVLWSAIFSPDGAHLLTVGGNGARLWDAASGSEQMSFSPHGAVASVGFSPDGRRIVTGSWDNSAKIWNAETGRPELKLAGGHDGHVNSAVFSPDGNTVLTAGDDQRIQLWDAVTAEVLAAFTGHTDRVRSAVFSTDGTRMVSGGNDKTARIWHVATRRELQLLQGHAWAVLAVSLSTDGLWVITGSEDNTAKIWDAESGQELLTLAGHTAPVTAVAFSPDGLRALTASRDSTAKLWDAQTGKEILTLRGHAQEVTSVSFSPDGRQVLTGSRDGTAVVWLADDWKAQ